jgi:hypothetical protein
MTPSFPPSPEATRRPQPATRRGTRTSAFPLISLILIVLLTACASTPAEELGDWYASGGRAHIRTLGDDAKLVNELSGSPHSRLVPACQELLTHVAAAEAYEPIPHEDAQSFWSAALDSFRRGASDCVEGARKKDGAQLSEGVTEIQLDGSGNLQVTVSTIRTGLGSS